MKYIPKTAAIPVKVEMIQVDEPLKLSEEGNIIITEQRGTHMTKEEFSKAITEITDKLNYYHYQLSEENVNEIKTNIDKLTEKKESFEKFLKKIGKED